MSEVMSRQTPGTLRVMAALMTTEEAARELAISPRTLSRWAYDGYVQPALRTRRGGYRWDIDDLRRQLAEKGQEG